MATEHPGSKSLFLRRNFAELSEPGAAIERSHDFLRGHAVWNAGEHRWTFKNGSIFKFGHLNDSKAIEHYLGTQVDLLILDQVEQLTENEYNRLQGSVRSTVDTGLVPHIRLSANPGGSGHGWVKARFIDAAPADRPYMLDNQTHRFVPAKVGDNQRLLDRDPAYPDRLRALGGALATAWLDGDWEHFEGQAFREWRRDVHVIKPFAIPREWPRWRAIDYGYGVPYCCLWGTRSPAGQRYVYRETYGSRVLAASQALTIKVLSAGEVFRNTVGDPAMWTASHNGRSIKAVSSEYIEMGVPLAKANNDRLAGKSLIHKGLEHDEDFPPTLQVFDTCTNLIRTLPSLVVDPNKPEDVDTDSEDHAYDTLRYLLMAMGNETSVPSRQTYATGRR